MKTKYRVWYQWFDRLESNPVNYVFPFNPFGPAIASLNGCKQRNPYAAAYYRFTDNGENVKMKQCK